MRKLALFAIMLGACWGQTTPQAVMSVRVSGITDSTPIDNRSSYTRQSTYYGFCATGSGTWTVQMQYGSTSGGSYTSFPESTSAVTNTSPGCAGSASSYPYKNFIKFVITGSASVEYTGTTGLYVNSVSTGSSIAWGTITGTLSNQTDLQSALNLKANLAGPTFSGTVTSGGGGHFAGNLTGDVTGNLAGAVTGNASTATALAANPADCASDRYANAIAASGDLTCVQINLAAGVTGNLAIGNLNSGTSASSTTFWRGDGTWATPTGSVTSVGGSFTGGLLSVAGSPVTSSGTLAFTVAGISGGIVYFSSASTWASSTAPSANLPIIWGGAGAAPAAGTKSGNTVAFVTTTGTQTSGDCVKIDANGNHVANGSSCSASSGNMTVTTGSGAPSGACTAGTTWYLNTTPTPRDLWFCDTSGTWQKVISTLNTGEVLITGSTGTAPGTPASNTGSAWFDSVTDNFRYINPSAVVTQMYAAVDCTGTGHLLKLNANGTGSCSADGGATAPSYKYWSTLGRNLGGTDIQYVGSPSGTGLTAEAIGDSSGIGFSSSATGYVIIDDFLPSTWTGTIPLGLRVSTFNTSAGGSVRMSVGTLCFAAGENLSGTSYNTAQTTNTGTASSDFGSQQINLTISSATTTGCSAGEFIRYKILRDNTVGSNSTAVLTLLGFYRTQTQ